MGKHISLVKSITHPKATKRKFHKHPKHVFFTMRLNTFGRVLIAMKRMGANQALLNEQ